jgi:hypothetical protein
MRGLRAILLHNRHLAVALVIIALAMKALVPPGYMVAGSSRSLTVLVCADSIGARSAVQVTIPQIGGKQAGGADPIQLALALAFTLALGFLAIATPRVIRSRRVLPPPCGPPSSTLLSIA